MNRIRCWGYDMNGIGRGGGGGDDMNGIFHWGACHETGT